MMSAQSLNGKARRANRFAQQARWEAEEAVAEYYDGHDDLVHERTIPVRRRADFLPTLMSCPGPTGRHAEQMTLPFADAHDESVSEMNDAHDGSSPSSDQREPESPAQPAKPASESDDGVRAQERRAAAATVVTVGSVIAAAMQTGGESEADEPAVPATGVKVVRPPSAAAVLQPPSPATSPASDRFTWRGFLTGCAWGGVAAAVLMTLVILIAR
jgi:hypothetical protein